jgi:hypothetical protein
VMRIDPAVVAISPDLPAQAAASPAYPVPKPSPDDTQLAFG